MKEGGPETQQTKTPNQEMSLAYVDRSLCTTLHDSGEVLALVYCNELDFWAGAALC